MIFQLFGTKDNRLFLEKKESIRKCGCCGFEMDKDIDNNIYCPRGHGYMEIFEKITFEKTDVFFNSSYIANK